MPGVNKHCRYLFMPELPGAARCCRDTPAGAGGGTRCPSADTALRGNWGRTCPSPAFTLVCPRVQSVCKGFPTPILFPSAAALTLGQFLTSSSSPHLQPLLARCELHTLVSVVLPQDPSPGRAVPSARPEPPQPRCPRCASWGGGGRAGTQPGPACRCLPQPTAATRRLRLAQRREHAPGLVNCASH